MPNELKPRAVRHGRAVALLAATTALALAAPAFAAGTPAGTIIDNTATATFTPSGGGAPVSVPSNTVSLTVDELLDVTVATGDTGDVVTTPSAVDQVTSFIVTNTGNGSEAFRLTANATIGGDDFDPTVTSIVLDSNGNGAYDPGVDTVYLAGSNDPVLDPDASIRVYVLSTIPAGVADSNRAEVSLTATAMTGSGTPGISFAGAGQGGGDAVVGSTGADGVDSGFFRISAANVTVTKSAVVADVFGGAEAVPGSTITYTLVTAVTGSGSLTNLAVTDQIPAGTTYKPGSITLQGSPLTDGADSDAGRFDGTGIAVQLGSLGGGQNRIVTFQVVID